jgi:hypothetical protein
MVGVGIRRSEKIDSNSNGPGLRINATRKWETGAFVIGLYILPEIVRGETHPASMRIDHSKNKVRPKGFSRFCLSRLMMRHESRPISWFDGSVRRKHSIGIVLVDMRTLVG